MSQYRACPNKRTSSVNCHNFDHWKLLKITNRDHLVSLTAPHDCKSNDVTCIYIGILQTFDTLGCNI